MTAEGTRYWQPPPGWRVEVIHPTPVKMGLPLFLMVAGQVGDLVTTFIGIRSGKLVEANPIGQFVLAHGWLAMIEFKALFVILVLALTARNAPKRRRRALLFVAIVGILVSFSNILQAYLS